jgi:hypothetical protein
MGITVRRLDRKELQKGMSKVLLSTNRVYVTADKSEAVEQGDPRAAFLLVGRGGIIHEDVARFYGIDTYEGEAISKMPFDAEAERRGMVTEGVGTGAAERYDQMSKEREIRQAIKGNVSINHPQYGRQTEFMAQGVLVRMSRQEAAAPETQKEAEEDFYNEQAENLAPNVNQTLNRRVKSFNRGKENPASGENLTPGDEDKTQGGEENGGVTKPPIDDNPPPPLSDEEKAKLKTDEGAGNNS